MQFKLPGDLRAERPGAVRARQSCGFTVIEMVVSMAVGATILLAGMSLTHSVVGASHGITEDLEATRTSVDFVSGLRADLNRARVETISPEGTTLVMRLPIPAGPAGSTIDATGETIWQVVNLDGSTTVREVTLTFVPVRLLSEALIGVDVNRDGDQVDYFDVGHITKTSSVDGPRALPRLEIVLVNGSHRGDVDGDGIDDPLFSMEAGSDEVAVRFAYLIDDAVIRMLENHCSVVPAQTP